MLIGLNTPTKPQAENQQEVPYIYDVTTADFEAKVLNVSLEAPVLIDFWAPWCGPCKQLMPTLEAEVKKAGGSVALAKVNIDEQPDLAAAFRVQSVPTVLAIVKGQPVGGFNGVRPAKDIESVITQLNQLAQQYGMKGMTFEEETISPHEMVQAWLDDGNTEDAIAVLEDLWAQDGKTEATAELLIRAYTQAGEPEKLQPFVEALSDVIRNASKVKSAYAAYKLAAEAAQHSGEHAALIAAVEKNPEDCAARFELAQAYMAGTKREEAAEQLLEILRRNKAWEDGKAKAKLLEYLEAWGFEDSLAAATRKKMSTILFS